MGLGYFKKGAGPIVRLVKKDLNESFQNAQFEKGGPLDPTQGKRNSRWFQVHSGSINPRLFFFLNILL